ncbi:uncharacterized protein LOC112525013 [Cynara cardunculus var. scolymus]|uniref:uncharacterized protein LOC112525013 n=1 Tax=Cynara cardunculus var. scolymus TaxID=59895 RepID=UPI000D625402|nr:uncharacterized protein LOC112525013 [Cynara cardunculus var. scolymus]
MVHKHAFEALDRSMNDIFNTRRSGDSHILFGGKVIIFGGDFRQILPVIPNAGRQDIVNASLSSSYIWEKCKVLRLTRNMRLTANSESSKIEQTRDFAKWILDLGEGKDGSDNDEEEKEYLSSDTLCESEHLHDEFDKTLYSPDVLNGLKLSGIPNHKILLKVGVLIMVLRNIDQKSGLCNGTRLQVLTLGNRGIEAQVISGSNIGSRTFIPRMSLTPTDKRIPFKFQRRQFPIAIDTESLQLHRRTYVYGRIIQTCDSE